jgi:hypothetical protein
VTVAGPVAPPGATFGLTFVTAIGRATDGGLATAMSAVPRTTEPLGLTMSTGLPVPGWTEHSTTSSPTVALNMRRPISRVAELAAFTASAADSLALFIPATM